MSTATANHGTDSLVEAKTHPTSIRLSMYDVMALRFLAKQDAHQNVSAAIRKLVDQRMRTEVGRDWESWLADEAAA